MEVSYFVFLFVISALFAVSPDIDLGQLFTSIFFYLLVKSERKTTETINDTETKKEVILYQDKYKKEFNLLDESYEYKERNIEHSFVMECTPLGNVIMRYDDEYEGFIYYSDQIIPHRFLDTVARKFALTYNCKKLVIDVEKVALENEEKIKQEKESYEREMQENKDMNQEDKKQKAEPEKKKCFC